MTMTTLDMKKTTTPFKTSLNKINMFFP